jgi:hypothetical protein
VKLYVKGATYLLSILKKEKAGKASNEIQLIGLPQNTFSFFLPLYFLKKEKVRI